MSEFRGNVLTAEELVRRRNKSDTIFPLRGPKLFSPSDSWLESKQLQSLLDATKDLLAEERVERESALSRAEWDDNLKVARVTRRVGHHFAKFGHEEDTTVFLYPEEALYMLETNTLEMLYGGVSMSIQQAYMILLNPKSGCTFLDYVVFSHLLKNGYKVLRHSPKRTVTRYEQLIGLQPGKVKNKKLGGEIIKGNKVNNCPNNKKVKEERNVKDDNKQSNCTKDVNEMLKNSNEWKDEGENISNVEVLFDGNSSDIEILSEKCTIELRRVDEGEEVNSEEKNYEDEDEERGEEDDDEEDKDEEEELNFGCSSFSSSRDSDCQVVFSRKEENKECSLDKKSIEEIHLSDSDESVGCVASNASPMKVEPTKLEITDIGVQECDVQCEELSNSSSGNICEISKETSGFIQFNESKFKDLDTINSSYLNSSNDLLESICRRQDLSILNGKERNLSLVNNVSIASASEICVGILNSAEEKLNENIEIKEESVNNTSESSTIKIESRKDFSKDKGRIEVIDLDDEPRIIESRWTILNSFPNAAGCHTVQLDVPPPSLCPADVRPFKEKYVIVLERLKDPRYGGSHKKKQTHKQRVNRSNHQRYEHRGNISRRHSNRYRSRPFNRRFSPRPRFRGHQYGGQYRECYREDVRFPNPTEFSPGSLMYPPIQNNYLSLRGQGHFPYFSGHQQFNQPYQQHRFDQSWDHSFNIHNQGPRDYPSNPHSQGPRNRHVLCRSSGRQRYRERTSQGSMITEDNSNCEDLNEEGGSYIPFRFNLISDETTPERRTRSQVHKRNSELSESSYSYCSGRKYSRVREDYSPFEQRNNTELRHSGNETSFQTLDSNNRPVIQSRRESLNSTTEDSVTDSSEDSSDSESSEESNDESMQESEGKQGDENVGSLLKSGFIYDIDAALKSLQIVKTTKLPGLSATVDEMLLSIKFDLYLPSTPFKKSDPPVPDFRLVIMSPDQTLPSSRQLSFLEGGFEDSVPLLFAIASADSVAFFLHSFLEFPLVHSSDKVQI